MIQENIKMKGIKINQKMVLKSQFADDTTLCLDGSEESLKESIQTLKKFCSFLWIKIKQ